MFELNNFDLSDTPDIIYLKLYNFLEQYELSNINNLDSDTIILEIENLNKYSQEFFRTISFSNEQKKSLKTKMFELYKKMVFTDNNFRYLDKMVKKRNVGEINRLVNIYKKDYPMYLKFINWYKKNIPNELIDKINPVNLSFNINKHINFIYEELKKEKVSSTVLKCLIDTFPIEFTNYNQIEMKDKIDEILNLLKDNDYIINKIDDKTNIDSIRKRLFILCNFINMNKNSNCGIKINIHNSKIYIPSELKVNFSKLTNFIDEDYPIIDDKNIITIDDDHTKALDQAFSIRKENDIYILNIYISDVPTFLSNNIDIARDAYIKGLDYYIKKEDKYISVKMLPRNLSQKLLSLNKNDLKYVINFTFYIDNQGNIVENTIEKNRIMVTDNISSIDTQKMLENGNNYNLKNDLINLKKLYQLLSINSNLPLQDINEVGLLSLLVNYFVGENADVAVYRKDGFYTKEKSEYTRSSTPLRKIVCDINLGLLLNQNGLLNIPDKYIYQLEDNIDEIIYHLNDTEAISSYIRRCDYKINLAKASLYKKKCIKY